MKKLVEVNDETYAALQRLAVAKNLTPAEVIAAMVNEGRPPLGGDPPKFFDRLGNLPPWFRDDDGACAAVDGLSRDRGPTSGTGDGVHGIAGGGTGGERGREAGEHREHSG